MADVVDITLVEFPGPLVLERFYATDASQCPLIHAHISSDTSFYCPTCAQTQRQIQVRKYTKLGSIQLGRLADNCQIFSVRQLSQLTVVAKCWQYISSTNIYFTKCTFSNPAPEGRSDTLQTDTFSPNVGNVYPIQMYILENAHSPTPRPKGAQTPQTDMIILDNYCQQLGVCVSWRVSVRPLGAGLVNVHFVICILVLDIYC